MKSATASANGKRAHRACWSRWMPSSSSAASDSAIAAPVEPNQIDAAARRLAPPSSIDRRRHQRLRRLELAQQALHVVDVRRALLGVARVAVLGRAAREVARRLRRMRARDTCGTGCRRRRRRGSGRSRLPASSSAAVITLPRSSARASSHANGSVSQSCMPMSRSSITKTGVCSRSARSNACAPNSKHSFGSSGKQQHVLGVAVRRIRAGQEVGLLRARRHAGRRAAALHVEEHRRESRRSTRAR